MSVVSHIVDFLAANPGLIAAALLLYVFIFALSLFFSSPKPGPNPFKKDVSRPAKPLVIDQVLRDKVIKQGFQSKSVPENLDAIVIGSGIGGLTVAAILSKAGKKVLVLEQHDQAGGCCHSFIEKGFEYDVGIHYVGEMRSNTVTRLLINQITEGQLQWVDLIEEFDVVALGEPGKQKLYPFRAGGHAAYKQAMLDKFPKEEMALDKYIALLREVRRNMMGMLMVKVMPKWIVRILYSTGLLSVMTQYFKYARRTVKDVLDEITDNDDLKAVLAYSWGDYGTEPSRGSFALHAALINHYLYGASYPRGGASEIAFHIIPVIEKAGGRVLVRAPVAQIIIDSTGKAVGVRVDKGTSQVEIFAPLVISDAGVVNTFTRLLPLDVAKKSSVASLIGSQVNSGIGCMSLFVGLTGTAEELCVKPQNIWAYTSNDITGSYEEYLARSGDDVARSDIPLLFITFPSAKDPTFNQRFPGKTVCTVVTMANWEWFSAWESERVMKRGGDYESVKMAVGRRMWEQVLAVYPQLADKVEHFDVGTPVTNKYYIGAPNGETYGLDHTVKRFGRPDVMMHLRPDSEIPGLLLAGQDVLSCGFAGAMFGGMLCASKALNRNLYQDLVNLKKQIAKAK